MPRVKQDLSKIPVDHKFTADDVKPLEQDADVVESEDDMAEEDDGSEEESECGELVACEAEGDGEERRDANRVKRKRKADGGSAVGGKTVKYMKTASGTFLVSAAKEAASTETGSCWFLVRNMANWQLTINVLIIYEQYWVQQPP